MGRGLMMVEDSVSKEPCHGNASLSSSDSGRHVVGCISQHQIPVETQEQGLLAKTAGEPGWSVLPAGRLAGWPLREALGAWYRLELRSPTSESTFNHLNSPPRPLQPASQSHAHSFSSNTHRSTTDPLKRPHQPKQTAKMVRSSPALPSTTTPSS